MAAVDQDGGLPRSETTTMIANANGTVHGAGCATSMASEPSSLGPNNAATMEPDEDSNPARTPLIAPAAVRLCAVAS